jgi:RNA polymerase sigma-70 factor (ECF subfamily)
MGAAETSPSEQVPSAEEVIRTYAPRIYNLARRFLGSDSDAEDVTQDVLMTVVRKLPTFRGESAVGTWLHRITVNAALGYRRKRAHRPERPMPDPLDDFSENGYHAGPVSRWSSAPDAELVDRETQQLIEQAISELPEPYRDVYVLADIEGISNAEIADMLGLSVAAVKSRLHRARLMMRRALAPHFEETPS